MDEENEQGVERLDNLRGEFGMANYSINLESPAWEITEAIEKIESLIPKVQQGRDEMSFGEIVDDIGLNDPYAGLLKDGVVQEANDLLDEINAALVDLKARKVSIEAEEAEEDAMFARLQSEEDDE